MSDTILVIDDKDRVASQVQNALTDSGVILKAVADTRAAKQLLLESDISLIICDIVLSGDSEAGLTLCRQLREHERFSQIPVVLLTDELGEDVVQRASESGAQGLVGWPFSPDAIKKRLFTLLGKEAPPAVAAPQVAPTAPPPPAAVAPASGPLSNEEKLKVAQLLLAQVLHSLKTSNLLDLVEREDIPDIVLQMTRTVCGDNSARKEEQVAKKPEQSESADVSMDLDSVFGIKK